MNELNVSRLVDGARLRPFHFWLTLWCLLAMMASTFFYVTALGPLLCAGCCVLLLNRLHHMRRDDAASPTSAPETQRHVAAG